jgi:hypothetical protein
VAQPIPTADDPVGDVIQQLEKCLRQLKTMNPEADAADSDAEEAQGRAALTRGDKAAALRHFDAAISKWGARIVAKKSLNPLLSEPSSPQRAHKLTAFGFNADPVVSALNAQLGRAGSLNLADRASRARAPAAGRTPPARPAAVVVTASAPPDVPKIRAIQADIAALDKLQRREGFTNERNARHAELSRQLRAELKKFRVQ